MSKIIINIMCNSPNCNKPKYFGYKTCCRSCFISEGFHHNKNCNSNYETEILNNMSYINHLTNENVELCFSYEPKYGIIYDNDLYKSVQDYINLTNPSIENLFKFLVCAFEQDKEMRYVLLETKKNKIIFKCCVYNDFNISFILHHIRSYYDNTYY